MESRVVHERVDLYSRSERLPGHLLEVSSTGGKCSSRITVEPGTSLAVGFRIGAGVDVRVFFLLGRVVWRVRGLENTYGLHWFKAETRSSPEDLRRFLQSFLRVPEPEVQDADLSGHAGPRSIYVFPSYGTEGEGPMSSGDAGGRTMSPIAEVSSKGSVLSTGRGPLTAIVSRGGLRAPCSIQAVAQNGAEPLRGTVTFLGANGMFLQTRLPQEARLLRGDLAVRFLLYQQGEEILVRCSCVIDGVDDGATTGTEGYDLSFHWIDDGKGGAALKQAIRDLHFAALTARG